MSDQQYDVSLIRPIITSAVAEHPERERLEKLLGAGAKVQLREVEPDSEKPEADSVDEIEFQAFVQDGDETIPIVSFPGYALVPPVIGKGLGPAVIDVGAVRRPAPQVRLVLTWPDAPEMPGIDVLLSRDEAYDVAQSLREAASVVQEMLDELGGWGD